ncbi:eukaryotic translation initiation factor 3 subunit F [Elysia marginata]|uniref:Eukaryotic translation initiation factor 3 subunit F n=1 Tax=Elysia marginata TaxID=1093978 RepID=A0AAV4JLS4_9GAST|nr:eukaryotic translation initiation factor 3 subunit F [Elysia marginata]
MKCHRKILRIPWCDRVTNEEVLERVNIQNCQLMNNIRKLKLTYFGYVKRHNTLEKLCMEGMVEGKRGRGCPKRRWSEDVAEWLKTPATRARATAQDRRLFRSLVWKATSSPDPP